MTSSGTSPVTGASDGGTVGRGSIESDGRPEGVALSGSGAEAPDPADEQPATARVKASAIPDRLAMRWAADSRVFGMRAS
jgi:hypothetical protein